MASSVRRIVAIGVADAHGHGSSWVSGVGTSQKCRPCRTIVVRATAYPHQPKSHSSACLVKGHWGAALYGQAVQVRNTLAEVEFAPERRPILYLNRGKVVEARPCLPVSRLEARLFFEDP